MSMKIVSVYKELPEMLEAIEQRGIKKRIFLDKLTDKLKKISPQRDSPERIAASVAIISHYLDYENTDSHSTRVSVDRVDEFNIETKLIDLYERCKDFAPKDIVVYVSLSNPKHIHLRKIKGVSGVTDKKNILIFIWPYQGWHAKVLDIFVHELAHAARDQKIHEKTLLEYVISEGIAQSVVQEVTGTYNRMRVPSEMKIWNLYKENLNVTNKKKIHKLVFGNRKTIPAMAGYFMGYRIVQNYLQKTQKHATQILHIPAKQILEASDYSKK